MVDLLLERIKYLENELSEKSKKIEQAKAEIIKLFKQCKIAQDKKEEFKNNFLKAINNLDLNSENEFFEGNFLKYPAFLKIIENINDSYLVLIDATFDEDMKKFVLGFLTKKISPFFTINKDIILGVIEEKQYKELKNLNTIPYYNHLTCEFSDIHLYKVLFFSENFNYSKIERAKKIFKEFRLRPIYKNKHFIEYSLDIDKIVDFEKEKQNKQKMKYSYILDESFANIETKIKRTQEIPLILVVLEKIDKEMDKIKSSKGIENIVIRILNYIEFNFPTFAQEVRFLRDKLKEG